MELLAYLAVQNVTEGATIFFRANDADGASIAFDNLPRSFLRGSLPWQPLVIVIDVPPTAETIGYGGVLIGGGTLWLDAAELRVLDQGVPTTAPAMRPQPYSAEYIADRMEWLPAPTNLDFEETVSVSQ